jgi:hypothetical protein
MLRVRLIKKQGNGLDNSAVSWGAVAKEIHKAPDDFWKAIVSRIPAKVKEMIRQQYMLDKELSKIRLGNEQKWSSETTMLCDLMSKVLDDRTGKSFYPNTIRKKITANHLRKWEVVTSTLEFRSTPTSMTHNARQLLYRKAINLLVKDIQRMGLPISPTLVLNHLHRIPVIYDNAFPTYVQSGSTDVTVGLPLS